MSGLVGKPGDVVCVCCHAPTKGRLCRECIGSLRPAPERIVSSGVRLVAPFDHSGAARRLMHLLKYRGMLEFAELTAELLTARVSRLPLVPVPRALSRKVRYGVDPALAIARALGRRLDVPVLRALVPPLHTRRRAGHDHGVAVRPFRVRLMPKGQVIVVDDVVTTGATIGAAVEALGRERVRLAAAANSVVGVSSLSAL